MATAGYSGTPLPKKLGIKPEMKILVINKPDDYYKLLEADISDQVCKKNETPDLVHLFVKNTKEFEAEMKKLKLFCKQNPNYYRFGFRGIKKRQKLKLILQKM